MTDFLARLRSLALLLPDVEERSQGDAPAFLVAGARFAAFDDGPAGVVLSVRTGGADDRDRLIADAPATYRLPHNQDGPEWVGIVLEDDSDWTLIEDHLAHSWELAAPAGALEAGGR